MSSQNSLRSLQRADIVQAFTSEGPLVYLIVDCQKRSRFVAHRRNIQDFEHRPRGSTLDLDVSRKPLSYYLLTTRRGLLYDGQLLQDIELCCTSQKGPSV